MNSLQNSGGSSNEEEDMLLAMHLCGIDLIAYAVKTATELDLFEIMAKARPLGTVADLAEKFTGGKQLIIINKICIKYFINIFSINL